MYKTKALPNQSFETKEALFAALKANEKTILTEKKASVKMFDPLLPTFDIAEKMPFTLPNKFLAQKGIEIKEDYIYPIINTCMVYDSHEDVSMPSSWTKSANEQNGKVLYTTDHEIKLDKLIAWEKDVQVKVTNVPLSFLNLEGDSEVEVLYFEVPKKSMINDLAIKAINENWPVQNSARLMYIDVKLAMNSSDPAHKENKALYDEVYPKIINKQDVPDYFYAIYQQKIWREGSMVVRGSNHATPVKVEPLKSTPNNEPSVDTQISELKEFINLLKF